MAVYVVTRCIKSAAELWAPHVVDGISLRPTSSPPTDDLLVSEEIEAPRYRDAIRRFNKHLLPVVDAISSATGAALMPLGASTLVEKKRGKYVLLLAQWRRPSGALALWPGYTMELLDDAARVAREHTPTSRYRAAAHYLRQAALAENVTTITFHGLQAVEALAGDPDKGRLNREEAERLLGKDLYRFFYRNDPMLRDNRRNALVHGRLVDEEGLGAKTHEMLTNLLGKIRDRFNLSGAGGFSPMRGFISNESAGLFLEPLTPLPPLLELVERAASHSFHTGSDPRWPGSEVSKRLSREW